MPATMNVAGSISDFTLRLNPSSENIATQANEDNIMTGGRISQIGNLRASLELN